MGKKKNKVLKITEEEYFAYVAGLKNDAALKAGEKFSRLHIFRKSSPAPLFSECAPHCG